ncbi:MAG: ATPase [Proteobacteria bacterium]|nr:ATPase [Pseudomonadota bacterium]
MKRFYQQVGVTSGDQGHQVRLDGKPVKTPARAALALPNEALARAVAGEWRAQKKTVKPEAMPLTRLANTAIDRTALHKGMVIGEIMNFARHDLLCYRAGGPEELIRIESEAWDPYLAWARESLGLAFKVTTGVETIKQDQQTLAKLEALLSLLDPYRLTALHTATTLSGSAILALALWQGRGTPAEIWKAAQADEDYQTGKWGADREHQKTLGARRDLWLAAGRFLAALKSAPPSGKSK